ncbi:MAG: DUF4276 family protein [Victivallales bacterium]|nr:DUF4276 family protein [Victivallales bacterium]
MIKNLVFLLEELSTKAMLEGIVPRLISSEIAVTYISFHGKQDLDNNIERKIRLWQKPDSAFIIIRDQDSSDCTVVKKQLMEKCALSGKENTLVRIACHELESFYLGDLEAVANIYQMKVPSQNNKKFREPDRLANAAEELSKITKKQYQKIDGSRRIAPFLKIDGTNCSHSFNVLCNGIRRVANS